MNKNFLKLMVAILIASSFQVNQAKVDDKTEEIVASSVLLPLIGLALYYVFSMKPRSQFIRDAFPVKVTPLDKLISDLIYDNISTSEIKFMQNNKPGEVSLGNVKLQEILIKIDDVLKKGLEKILDEKGKLVSGDDLRPEIRQAVLEGVFKGIGMTDVEIYSFMSSGYLPMRYVLPKKMFDSQIAELRESLNRLNLSDDKKREIQTKIAKLEIQKIIQKDYVQGKKLTLEEAKQKIEEAEQKIKSLKTIDLTNLGAVEPKDKEVYRKLIEDATFALFKTAGLLNFENVDIKPKFFGDDVAQVFPEKPKKLSPQAQHNEILTKLGQTNVQALNKEADKQRANLRIVKNENVFELNWPTKLLTKSNESADQTRKDYTKSYYEYIPVIGLREGVDVYKSTSKPRVLNLE